MWLGVALHLRGRCGLHAQSSPIASTHIVFLLRCEQCDALYNTCDALRRQQGHDNKALEAYQAALGCNSHNADAAKALEALTARRSGNANAAAAPQRCATAAESLAAWQNSGNAAPVVPQEGWQALGESASMQDVAAAEL